MGEIAQGRKRFSKSVTCGKAETPERSNTITRVERAGKTCPFRLKEPLCIHTF